MNIENLLPKVVTGKKEVATLTNANLNLLAEKAGYSDFSQVKELINGLGLDFVSYKLVGVPAETEKFQNGQPARVGLSLSISDGEDALLRIGLSELKQLALLMIKSLDYSLSNVPKSTKK